VRGCFVGEAIGDGTYYKANAKIETHHDDTMSEPWKEHDGHGIVSEWVRRDKRAGELLLCSDRSSKLFYDYAGTIALAKKDGWGMCPEHVETLTIKLGRTPTAKEITAASVMADFELLRAWCNNEWFWQGYTTKIETPDGEIVDGDSCWGFDDEAYMMEEATSAAISAIDSLVETANQTMMTEAMP